MSFELLRMKVLRCTETCPCRGDARLPVPPDGPANLPIMLIGRNPGRDEDARGRPFVGRSGELLTAALSRLGLFRGVGPQVVITNAVKCYTAQNRPPTAGEYATCMANHLVHEMLFSRPTLIITFGADVATRLTGSKENLTRSRQRFWPLPSIGASVLPMLHPSAVLRDPTRAALWWADWEWLSRQPLWNSICASAAS